MASLQRPQAISELMPISDQSNPSNHACEGAEFHSPRPLRVHGYRLADNHVLYLCGTCRDNVDIYVALWESQGGLPWSVQRSFGNRVRNAGNMVLHARKGH